MKKTIRFGGSAVETRFVGPTNYRGPRVAGKHLLTGKRVMRPWQHELGSIENHDMAARAVLGEAVGKLRYYAVSGGRYIWTRDRIG
jgi:hypothetical protein